MDLNESDGSALGDRHAQLIGEQAHHRGVLDPGNLLELCAAPRQRHEEEIAPDIGAEDGEQIGAGQLSASERARWGSGAVAEGLDGGGGFDAEARIALEGVADGQGQGNYRAQGDKDCGCEQRHSPAGAGP